MANDQNILADLAVAVDVFTGGSDSQCEGCPKVLARGSVFTRNMSLHRRSWPYTDMQLSHKLDYSDYMIRNVYPLILERIIVKKIHLDIIEN